MRNEEFVIAHLSKALPCRVCADVPEKRPSQLVTVERVGGAGNMAFDAPQFSVKCWDATRAKASSLASQVDESVQKLEELDYVYKVERIGAAYLPAEKGEPRYQLVYSIHIEP